MSKKKRPPTDSSEARQEALGRQLRQMYDKFTKEPLPEDLVDLLDKLDEKLKKPGNGSDSKS